MEDKNIDQFDIEPRLESPVKYQEDPQAGFTDANGFTQKALFAIPKGSSSNLPFETKGGVLLHLADQGQNKYGKQLYINSRGDLASRIYSQSSASDATKQQWVTSIGWHYTVGDFNSTFLASGIYRVEATAQNHSSLWNDDPSSKWGILQHYQENDKTGIQMYAPIDGKHFGKIYIRAYDDNKEHRRRSNNAWKEINVHSLQNGFNHHAESHTMDITQNSNAGYYHTNKGNTGFPPECKSNEDKTGVLKVLIKGDKKYLSYTPTEGKYKGRTWQAEYDSSAPSRSGNELQWVEVNKANGHVKIFDTRDQRPQITPQKYEDDASGNKGYTVYEWKWTDHIDIGDTGKYAVVQTFVPDGRDITDGAKQIFQIAHIVENGHMLIRRASEDKQSWSRWEYFHQGGTTDGQATINFQKEFDKMITTWTHSSSAEDPFSKWLHTHFEKEFEQWVTNREKPKIQENFDDYINHKLKTMFDEWIKSKQ